ncbi:MAG: hypothetical protein IKP47_08665 [Ruminococcus sp.]|nr:hypothetical protein [Ruminococcus sp.]
MNSFRTQLRIMLHKRGFQIGFTVMMLFVAYSFVRGMYYVSLDPERGADISNLQAVDRALLNKTNESYGIPQILRFIFPFVCVLPFSFSLFIDRSTRISDIVIARSGKRRYYFSKLAAAFAGGFIIFFIPLLISTALTHIFCSSSIINVFDINFSELTAGGKEFFTMGDLMLELITFSPALGELFAALLLSVYAGACAMLALALSYFFRRFAVFIFVPVFLLCKLFELWESMIKVDCGYMYLRIDPLKYSVISSDNPYYGRPYWIPAAEIAVIIAVSAGIMLFASRRDQLQ